jgi:hypothetical protein
MVAWPMPMILPALTARRRSLIDESLWRKMKSRRPRLTCVLHARSLGLERKRGCAAFRPRPRSILYGHPWTRRRPSGSAPMRAFPRLLVERHRSLPCPNLSWEGSRRRIRLWSRGPDADRTLPRRQG